MKFSSNVICLNFKIDYVSSLFNPNLAQTILYKQDEEVLQMSNFGYLGKKKNSTYLKRLISMISPEI